MSQEVHISGTISISLAKKNFSAEYYVTNLEATTTSSFFLLNDQLTVTDVAYNNTIINFSKKKSKNCLDCLSYEIKNKTLTKSDTIRIKVTGTIAETDKYDYKGIIAIEKGILRASEQSKWLPLFITTPKIKHTFLERNAYLYELTITSEEDIAAYITGTSPKTLPATFSNTSVVDQPLLIIGNFDWKTVNKHTYINFTDAEIENINTITSSVTSFYSNLISEPYQQKITYVKLATKNSFWSGFSSFPSIVLFEDKNTNKEQLMSLVSHELAHYYFGTLYSLKNEFYWFYSESFAEYFSLKYLLSENKKQKFFSKYAALKDVKKQRKFKALKRVKKLNDISSLQRYTFGPFQLFAIEHTIGTDKTIALIKAIFSESNTTSEKAYIHLRNCFEAIGVKDGELLKIETLYLNSLSPKSYQFIDTW